MSDATLTSYEQVPYESAPVLGAHPDNLASLATLFGLDPPPVENCRVLELGCATGGNLIAIADSLPSARCVGIDLSPSQVAAGRELCRTLGLTNIDMRAGSILEIGPDWGEFDFIICHGVWSWVPPEVRDHILAVCSSNLAPHGIAYVSYNVYPGWHVAGMIRDMVNFHGRRFPDPRERVAQVRKFIEFLTKLVQCDPENALYYNVLVKEVEGLRESGDSYLFHEYLETFNQPVYFSEFAARAAAADLQFLSEAQISIMVGNLPAAVKDALHDWSEDIIAYEQYLDFVRNRRFRRTLLCHASETVQRVPEPSVVRRLRFSGIAQPMTESPPTTSTEQFRNPKGVTWTTNNPWMQALARAVWDAAPRSLTLSELAERVRAALPVGTESSAERVAQTLLQGVLSNLIECHVFEPAFVAEVSAQPVASPLAQALAAKYDRLPNRRHRMFEVDGLHRQLILALDGSRDRQALIDLLADRVRDGMPLLDENDLPVHEPHRVRELLSHGLDPALRQLARNAMLVA